MKHLKRFENFSYMFEEIENISYDEFENMIEDGAHPFLVAFEGESASGQVSQNKNIPILTAQKVVYKAEQLEEPIIIIDEDAFPSIPASILSNCTLAIISDVENFYNDLENISVEVYIMPY